MPENYAIGAGIGSGQAMDKPLREATLTERVMQLTQECAALRKELGEMAADHYKRITTLESKVG